MSKAVIGGIVAGVTVVGGAGAGLGIGLSNKNHNKPVNVINLDLQIDQTGADNNCKETTSYIKCGNDPISITEQSHNGEFFLNKAEVYSLYNFYTTGLTHGAEIGFVNGVHLTYNAPNSNDDTFAYYEPWSKQIWFNLSSVWQYKNIQPSINKLAYLKYNLAHEYGHHLTHYYFKNGIAPNGVNRVDYHQAGTNSADYWAKDLIDKYIGDENNGRNLSNQDKFLCANGQTPKKACDYTNPQGFGWNLDENKWKYWVSLVEWIAREYAYFTITDPFNYGAGKNAPFASNPMATDSDIRRIFGEAGGEANLNKATDHQGFAWMDKFLRKAMGLTDKRGITAIHQVLADSEPYNHLSAITGYIPADKDYKCIAQVDNGSISKFQPIKTNKALLNYKFRHTTADSTHPDSENNLIAGTFNDIVPYHTNYFNPNSFDNNKELYFSSDCNVGSKSFERIKANAEFENKTIIATQDGIAYNIHSYYDKTNPYKGYIIGTKENDEQKFVYYQ